VVAIDPPQSHREKSFERNRFPSSAHSSYEEWDFFGVELEVKGHGQKEKWASLLASYTERTGLALSVILWSV
jgi:hypothetical protein